MAPGEGGRRGRGQPLRTPIAFPVSSAPPGRGPSREVASPGDPEPTRATESWEGNPDTPPYSPALEEGERIQRDLGRAATFSFSRARGSRQPDGLSPCISFAEGVPAGLGRRRRWRVVGDSGGAEAVVEGLVPPSEGGEGEGADGSRLLRTPIAFPVSSAPPGRGPSREIANRVVPQPTRATESWEGNPDIPPYGPAPEEGERIQRDLGRAATFSFSRARGWRQPDGLSPCISFAEGVPAGLGRRRRRWVLGGFSGSGGGGRGFGAAGRGRGGRSGRGQPLRTPIDFPFLRPSRPRTVPGGCKPGRPSTDTGYGKLGRKPGHTSLQPCTGWRVRGYKESPEQLPPFSSSWARG